MAGTADRPPLLQGASKQRVLTPFPHAAPLPLCAGSISKSIEFRCVGPIWWPHNAGNKPARSLEALGWGAGRPCSLGLVPGAKRQGIHCPNNLVPFQAARCGPNQGLCALCSGHHSACRPLLASTPYAAAGGPERVLTGLSSPRNTGRSDPPWSPPTPGVPLPLDVQIH